MISDIAKPTEIYQEKEKKKFLFGLPYNTCNLLEICILRCISN